MPFLWLVKYRIDWCTVQCTHRNKSVTKQVKMDVNLTAYGNCQLVKRESFMVGYQLVKRESFMVGYQLVDEKKNKGAEEMLYLIQRVVLVVVYL